MKNCIIPLITVLLLVGSCSGEDTLRRAAATITADELRDYTSTLGADSFMGRKPFTPGETITIEYLSGELEKIGFRPAFGESWFQEVPMVEITTRVEGKVQITAGKERLELTAPDDIAIESPSDKQIVVLDDIPMVFCGFGIVAPEYCWNDYANIDVKGKCAVVTSYNPLARDVTLEETGANTETDKQLIYNTGVSDPLLGPWQISNIRSWSETSLGGMRANGLVSIPVKEDGTAYWP